LSISSLARPARCSVCSCRRNCWNTTGTGMTSPVCASYSDRGLRMANSGGLETLFVLVFASTELRWEALPANLLPWLCLSALAAGAINSVAGGGTLLTFSALLAALVPQLGPYEASVVANATSTVALVPGSLAGAWGYRHEMHVARRWTLLLLGPS